MIHTEPPEGPWELIGYLDDGAHTPIYAAPIGTPLPRTMIELAFPDEVIAVDYGDDE